MRRRTEDNYQSSIEIKRRKNFIKKVDKNIDAEYIEHQIGTKRDVNYTRLWLIILGIICVVGLCVIIFATINKFNTNIYNNIYVNDVDFSNKTFAELKEYLISFAKKIENKQIHVTLNGETVANIGSNEIKFSLNADETYRSVAEFGREENIITSNMDIIYAILFRKKFDVECSYSKEELSLLIAKLASNLDDRVVDDIFELNEETATLTISRGKSGLDVDKEAFKQNILAAMLDEKVEISMELPIYTRKPNNLDADVICSQVVREAKDAYVDETTNKYVKHICGIAIDKEKLEQVLAFPANGQEGVNISFKVDIIQPKIKLGDLKKDLYADKISTFSTKFTLNDYNRNTNIKVAAGYINNTIVMPNEEFSFNKVVGDCGLTSRGFKVATIFSGGGVDLGVGGGICQVSSTLYNVAVLANLEITERHNHGYSVGYVAASRDATIYYPYLNLKFKNTRTYPIKIVTSYNDGGSITISIYGTYEEKEYNVSIESSVLSLQSRSTIYQRDNTLDVGTQKVKQYGQDGLKSIAYKVVKNGDEIISKTLLSSDEYKPMNKIIIVGTKPKTVNPYSE